MTEEEKVAHLQKAATKIAQDYQVADLILNRTTTESKTMKNVLRKIYNLLLYGKWTDCDHPHWEPDPDSLIAWICTTCGVWRDGPPPQKME